jgi:hypothetical protein
MGIDDEDASWSGNQHSFGDRLAARGFFLSHNPFSGTS